MSKDAAIFARISLEMEAELKRIADAKGEGISVVVREALREYLERRAGAAGTMKEETVPYSSQPKGPVSSAKVVEIGDAIAKHKADTYRSARRGPKA